LASVTVEELASFTNSKQGWLPLPHES
jgi:hypothetical protein